MDRSLHTGVRGPRHGRKVVLRPDGTGPKDEFEHRGGEPPVVSGKALVAWMWLRAGERRIIVDCRHGQSSSTFLRENEDQDLVDLGSAMTKHHRDIRELLMLKHAKRPGSVAELCGCEPDSPRIGR